MCLTIFKLNCGVSIYRISCITGCFNILAGDTVSFGQNWKYLIEGAKTTYVPASQVPTNYSKLIFLKSRVEKARFVCAKPIFATFRSNIQVML